MPGSDSTYPHCLVSASSWERRDFPEKHIQSVFFLFAMKNLYLQPCSDKDKPGGPAHAYSTQPIDSWFN